MSSVCLSVTLVDHDHIGWKSYKLTARTISPSPSLFATQRPSTYSQGNMGKYWGETRGGVGKKWCAGAQKRQYHPRPPTASCSPRLGFATPKTSITIISGMGKATDIKFGWYIHRAIRTKAHCKFWRKGRVGVSRDCPIFLSTHYYLRKG